MDSGREGTRGILKDGERERPFIEHRVEEMNISVERECREIPRYYERMSFQAGLNRNKAF